MQRAQHNGVLPPRSRASAGLRRPASDPTPDPNPRPAGVDTAKIVEYVSLIAAPATLVSALVYWLGFELVDARSAYFGIGTGMLGFSTTDYLVRGAEAGIVPLFVLFTAALVVILLHAGVTALAARAGDAAWLHRAAAGVALAGVLVFVVGLIGLFRPLPPPLDWYLLRPVLLAGGPLLAIEAARMMRRRLRQHHARMAAVAVAGLVALSAFWAMSIYADALGRGRAMALAVTDFPAVHVYSERSLGVTDTLARADRLTGPDERYPYRYSGLRLLVLSGGKYFLLPDGWTHGSGTLLVLPDTPDIRVEFSPGGS
jgi:hypothetical protein